MRLPSFCIDRPVFTCVLSLVLILVGLLGFQHLVVRQLPEINLPVATVSTSFPGASAELMETEITTPIEGALLSVDNVDSITSTSSDSSSNITIRFKRNTDINTEINDVRNAISRVQGDFPEDANTPVVSKNESGDGRVLILSVIDPSRSDMAITDYINRFIRPQVVQVDGVASFQIFGARYYNVRVWLDAKKMAARKVSPKEVTDALTAQNVNIASGQIKTGRQNFSVVANARLKTVDGFKSLVINNTNGYITRLSDVAKVEIGPSSSENGMWVNGKPAVGVGIIPQSTANPIEVANGVKKELDFVRKTLPPGMKIEAVYDDSIAIKASIDEVYKAIAIAIVLVFLVVILFLGSFRSSLIPIITIPICLLGVFGPLYAVGYTINIVTLLALVLAIGLVVDDAIVMMENIHRHIELGATPYEAAKKGSQEIVFAVVAMTLTLATVFAPIAFTQGLIGSVFREFAFTLALSVIISGFVALTLTPMMCARLLPAAGQESRMSHWIDARFEKVIATYRSLLQLALRNRWAIVVAFFASLGLGYLLHQSLPNILSPAEDDSVVQVHMSGTSNDSFGAMKSYIKPLDAILAKVPEKENRLIIGSGSNLDAFLILKPWDERSRSQQDIGRGIGSSLKNLPGLQSHIVSPPPFGIPEVNNQDIAFWIMSSADYDELSKIVKQFIKKISDNNILTSVDHKLKYDTTEFQIEIDRGLVGSLGINMADVATALSIMLRGQQVTNFAFGGKNYSVRVQLNQSTLKTLDAIRGIYIKNADGHMLPLSTFVTIKAGVAPASLPHINQSRTDTIMTGLAPGATMGQAIDYLESMAAHYLPENTKYTFTGPAKEFLDSAGAMTTVFILALVFIYLVLAAQFESFIDPLIVLLSVPLCVVGGLLALFLFQGSLNIYSNIGLVTLIGLVSKHGILITEFANQLRSEGQNKLEAVTEAACLRLRPILMTTGAMVLGAVPLAVASGAGAQSRIQIGLVIVGGMLVGTLFSLFVVPVAYVFLSRDHRSDMHAK